MRITCAATAISPNKITVITDKFTLIFAATCHCNSVVFFNRDMNMYTYTYSYHGCKLLFVNLNVFQGDLVYANYGEEKDFKLLSTKGVSCQDKIVIVRYGRIFPGQMVKEIVEYIFL